MQKPRQASLRAGQAGLKAGGQPEEDGLWPAFGQPRLGARPGWCPRGPAFWPAQSEPRPGGQAGHWPEPAGLVAGQART